MPSNIPAVRTTIYTKVKPELKLSEAQRACFLTFKTDKKTKVKPDSVAIILNTVSYTTLIHQTDKGGTMLQELVNEYQDLNTKRAHEGLGSWDLVEDAQAMVTDFFDTTRTRSGNKVSKEVIGLWFDAQFKDFLFNKVAAKYPQFTGDKIDAVLKQYRQVFSDLAAYNMPQTKQVYVMMDKAWTEFLAQPVAEGEETTEDDMVLWISERIGKLGDKHKGYEQLVDAI